MKNVLWILTKTAVRNPVDTLKVTAGAVVGFSLVYTFISMGFLF